MDPRLHDASLPTAGEIDVSRVRLAFEEALAGSGAARWRTTASTGWCCGASLDLARGHCPARLLQISAPDRHRLQPELHGGDARRQSGDRALPWCSCSETRFDPGVQRRATTAQRGQRGRRSSTRSTRSPISTKTASCAASSTSSCDAAHQLLPDRDRWASQALPLVQARLPSDRRAAAAAAAWSRSSSTAPRVEGVHLRGGKVARGGIRWSDRREDFRTEVLGLMKAQMVKNAVIVPVGSKGGFVVKRPPARRASREALKAEGIECYKTLMRGLLDITDNLVGDGTVVPPPKVVRHDDDDPYLVVAADKGTATFSDIANAVSARIRLLAGRRLRLGRLGRLRPQEDGHHRARRLGVGQAAFPRARASTCQTHRLHRASASATCRATCSATACCCRGTSAWSAAFNHLHIFIDPDPDPAASFAERERLFDLPRSTLDRLRPGADLARRRRLRPQGQVDRLIAARCSARFGIDAGPG